MTINAKERGHPDIHAYDQLTGLYNRSHFLKKIKQLDLPKYFPLSIMMGNINDLKLINCIFGYNAGDSVIDAVAKIFKRNCWREGLVARWSGNVFAAAFPETGSCLSPVIIRAIKRECELIAAVPIKITITLGVATKEKNDQDIGDVIKNAEARLDRNKLIEAKNLRSATIASLVNLLGKKSYETEEHAWRMQSLAVQFGMALGLADRQLEDLILTVTLHDIGKLAIPQHLLLKPTRLTPAEKEIIKGHAVKGCRIVFQSSELAHLAPAILTHHERWDGRGYPLGLKGEEIPLLARIVAIVDSYDVMTHERPYKKAMPKKEARQELLRGAGSQFDPELVKMFLKLDL